VSVASEVMAIRRSAGLSRADHVALVRVEGPAALEVLQAVSTQSPYAREGRVRHTLLLREDAGVFADAFVVKAEEDFLVVAEGPSEEELVAWLSAHVAGKAATVRGMRAEWTVYGVDGPYAWEVVAGLCGPVVLGMPYLALLRHEDLLCLRAGKTGEYGYLLLVPRAQAETVEARLAEVGGPLDLVNVGLEALDVCALENWHFSMRNVRPSDLVAPLTPIELQLQWRVIYGREFVGAAALRARRAEGAKARVTCFVAPGPVASGQRVRLGRTEAGEVLAARASPTLGVTVGSALLDLRVAHPHLDFSAVAPEGELPLRTCTASLVENKSLRVQPHKHSYATRNDEAPAG
jgi:glycine cleavage system aminomethyltransferase T